MSKQKKRKWKVDDLVSVEFEGEQYEGSIVELKGRKATVLFDDGDLLEVKQSDLELLEEQDDESDVIDKSQHSNVGFNQYNIHWADDMINFKFKAEGGEFYGWWRKCRIGCTDETIGYAIDLHVKFEGKLYNIDSIHYMDNDPREDLQSLNGDICAACNKWFYYKCNGDFDTIKSLQQKANKPTIFIRKLATLDTIILTLKDYRDTAIRCGGQRVLIIEGDEHEDKPSGGLRLDINLSTQALGFKGKKVPSLYAGVMLDGVAENNKKNAPRKERIVKVANPEDVQMLQDKLSESTDPKEKRKIRAQLRKLGHKGGGRNAK